VSRFRLGVGFNPGYLSGALALPSGAARLEGGTSLYRRGPGGPALPAVAHHSLHLARAPFSEAPTLQEAFVAGLERHLPDDVGSIGLHLCGRFDADLGWFGLGTSFVPTAEAKDRSERLMDGLARLDRPILIENADLYPHDLATALRSLSWSNHLCRAHGAGLILDLAHLLVAATNLGVEPRLLLGRIDLDAVRVVHLSGVVRGKDGSLHDGHTQAVAPEVWALLDEALPLLPDDLDVVLEHSDPSWIARPAELQADWDRLVARAEAAPAPSRALPIDRDAVGVGYMANVIVPQNFPALVHALGRAELGALVREWAPEYLERVARSTVRLAVLRRGDDFWPEADKHDPLGDFDRFVRALVEDAA
jgi:hypothetical protein